MIPDQELARRLVAHAPQLEQAVERLLQEAADGPATLGQRLVERGLISAADLLLLTAAEASRAPPTERIPEWVEQELHQLFDGAGTGSSLGRYRVTGELGRGGMGRVLRVRDEQLDREVAAKVLPGAGDELRARFVREARITGQLEHPNIVPVHELSVDQAGRPYYTMKQIRGRTLAQILAEEERTRPPLIQLLQIFLKVCDAMALAHSRGVIHRDLKPANIMVGEFGEVLVLDWGLATMRNAECGVRNCDASSDDPFQTQVGTVMGTPAYMAPEQARGEGEAATERTDVYALGAMLYEILTELPAYEGEGERLLERVREGALVAPSRRAPSRAIPWELEAAVLRAMAHAAEDRYPTVTALRADLEAFLAGGLLWAADYGLGQLVWRWVRRRWKTALAGGVLLAGAGAFTAYYLVSQARQARLAHAYLEQRDRAERRGEEATRNLAAYERMADVKRLADLERETDRHWLFEPTEPRRLRLLQEMARWLTRARGLLARLPQQRADLERLRRSGRREAQGEWRFERTEERWRHEVLAGLVGGLEALAGKIGGVEQRIEELVDLRRRSIELHRARWEQATSEIADRKRSPQYGGLRIAPQLGLVPVGRDSASGLWLFAHLGSGKLPRWTAGGRLQLSTDGALLLVLLPGGRFSIGARRPRPGEAAGPNIDPTAYGNEQPVQQVELQPFFIGKFELTQAQWLALAGANPSGYRPGVRFPGVPRFTLRHPVESVNWHDCQRVLSRAGLALPSEAQWEYAARGGTRTVWWTGDDPRSLAGAANLADRTLRQASGAQRWEEWLDDRRAYHAPAGSFLPNRFGLHDVTGNVWEWCLDAYVPRAYLLPLLPGGRGLRQLSAEARRKAVRRVIRGGSWHDLARSARSAGRFPRTPTDRNVGLGVRAARALY